MVGIGKALAISLACIALDQLSKHLVAQQMFLSQSLGVLGSFFRITYVRNPGGAFGITIAGPIIYMALAAAATVIVVGMLYRSHDAPFSTRLSLAVILGGACGNLIDRIRFGEVVDFIDVGLGDLRWPVFNFADVFVTSGAILLFFRYLVRKDSERTTE